MAISQEHQARRHLERMEFQVSGPYMDKPTTHYFPTSSSHLRLFVTLGGSANVHIEGREPHEMTEGDEFFVLPHEAARFTVPEGHVWRHMIGFMAVQFA